MVANINMVAAHFLKTTDDNIMILHACVCGQMAKSDDIFKKINVVSITVIINTK